MNPRAQMYEAARKAVPLPTLWAEFGWSVTAKGSRMTSATSPCCGEASRDDAVSMQLGEGGEWRWKCFRCSAGGTAIDAVALHDGISHFDAAKKLVLGNGGITAITGRVVQKRDRQADENREVTVARVMRVMLDDESTLAPDPVIQKYLEDRGISMATVKAAAERGIVRFLPGNPAAADAWWRLRLGEDAMIAAKLMREGARYPASAYRPIVFFSQDGKGCEFKTAGRSQGPKAIQYGHPQRPIVWLPDNDVQPRRIAVVEGGFDLLSIVDLGMARDTAVLAILGASAWRDAWIEEFQTVFPDATWDVGLDADEAGEKTASSLIATITAKGHRAARKIPPGGVKDWNDALVASRAAF